MIQFSLRDSKLPNTNALFIYLSIRPDCLILGLNFETRETIPENLLFVEMLFGGLSRLCLNMMPFW